MTDSQIHLQVEKLSHRFSDGTFGIKDISFQVHKGDFLLISGPNGSGKSVLMKHLNGLLSPTKGNIFLNGKPIDRDLTETRRKIGLVFQDADSQIIGQTVKRDTAFGPENLRLSRKEIDKRVMNSLRSVNLEERMDSRPHILSGGEKRRLAVAGVLAMDPEIIVFDEPFSNLDYQGVKQVLRQIERLHNEGHTIILITHDLGKVLAHGSSLIIMNKGKIVEQGPPADLIDSLEKWEIRRPPGVVSSMTWLK